ncbi:tol-pal system protein YbgF [Montanilutibacter psychrotolerans]|uniref:Cell division coordinator CpoB n=1 Tax=Montanilutibacter psychrotolerans TaxID=1327343 RepID=A0A3M8SXN9_9GAMM|nr:tol-pal system protein YbgF [Lysobacter psychrotolerans]RNF84216.1 tol-pal system protein YbgF [Lysobacter psychrotolerans]
MRKLLVPATLAAALVAAAPAYAQRASLADRVAVLEQRAAANQANVDLLNQVSQLKTEVQALRAQIEELQQANNQLKQTARSQYIDLDGRVNRLEGGDTGATRANVPVEPPPAPPSAAVDTAPAAQDTAPTVYGDAGAVAMGAGEREAYDAAFNTLKGGDYSGAAREFHAFLDQHPNGAYAPNALYWLGESYYVTQNYQLALGQFQALLERYPTHDKAPGALLKVGLSQQGLRQTDAAERTLSEVTTRYPGTDAARVAADRLSALQLGRLQR